MRVDLLDREIGPPQLALAGVVLATALALVVAASTSGVAFGSYNPAWDGAADLRAIADETGATATVLQSADGYATDRPDRTVAVLLAPDEPYTLAETARIREFVRRGGTLVVADDVATPTNRLLANLNVSARIDGTPLRDERYNYRSAALPVARNVSEHPLTAGVDRLTLNYGTAVEPGNATVLVRTSGFAYRDANRNGELDETESLDAYPVATVESLGRGEVVVVGDASAFINAMLERPGNRAFVRTLFGRHDRVLLDYTHAAGLPPLIALVLALRAAPLAQFALGGGLLLVIGAWSRTGPGAIGRLRARLERSPSGDTRAGLTAEQTRRYLERRHPEWDPERVDRVTKAVINRRPKDTDDERR